MPIITSNQLTEIMMRYVPSSVALEIQASINKSAILSNFFERIVQTSGSANSVLSSNKSIKISINAQAVLNTGSYTEIGKSSFDAAKNFINESVSPNGVSNYYQIGDTAVGQLLNEVYPTSSQSTTSQVYQEILDQAQNIASENPGVPTDLIVSAIQGEFSGQASLNFIVDATNVNFLQFTGDKIAQGNINQVVEISATAERSNGTINDISASNGLTAQNPSDVFGSTPPGTHFDITTGNVVTNQTSSGSLQEVFNKNGSYFSEIPLSSSLTSNQIMVDMSDVPQIPTDPVTGEKSAEENLVSVAENAGVTGRALEGISVLGGVAAAVGYAALAVGLYEASSQAIIEAEAGKYNEAAQTLVDFAAAVSAGIIGADEGVIIGGETGAVVGAALGGPPGAIIGAEAGALAGSIVGAISGSVAGSALAEDISTGVASFIRTVDGALGNSESGVNLEDPGAPLVGGGGIANAFLAFLAGMNRSDPLVIDLTGKGFNLTPLQYGSAYYDFSGNGFAHETGWVGAGTGFLVIENSSGQIQMLGNGTISGFAALSAYDSNGDGMINSSDPIFSQLRVWEDVGGNGQAGTGQLLSLQQLGIASISLNDTQSDTVLNGNTIKATASFTFDNETTGQVGEVMFETSPTYTQADTTVAIPSAINGLPELQGYGSLRDLHSSMVANPILLTLVQNFTALPAMSAPDAIERAVQGILYEWAGVTNVNPVGPDPFANANEQQLQFLQKYLGETYFQSSHGDAYPSAFGVVDVNMAWNDAFNGIAARLILQSPVAATMPEFQYDPTTDMVLPVSTVSQAITSLYQRLGAPTEANFSSWRLALQMFDAFSMDIHLTPAGLYNVILQSAPQPIAQTVAALANAVASGQAIGFSAAGSFMISGTTLNDTIYAAPGISVLVGNGGVAAGNNGSMLPGKTPDPTNGDIFVYNVGDGRVEINEAPSVAPDQYASEATLQLGAGISMSDITASADQSGNIFLAIGTSGDVIKLDNQLNSNLDGISAVTFADGSILTSQQLVAMADTGSINNQTLYAPPAGAATFTPAGYAHTVIGYEQGDVINYAVGDGNLNINEFTGYGPVQATLAFGAGITASEIAVSSDNSTNMYLEVGTTGSTIVLENQLDTYEGNANGISMVTFADGTTLTAQQLFSMADLGSATNQTLYAPTTGAATFNLAGHAHAVVGHEQGDVINYAAGDGNLNISEYIGYGSLQATLAFGAGITASEITVSADSLDNMYLLVGTTGGTITLDNQLNNYYNTSGISELTFADGTTLSAQQLVLLADTGSVINQTLYGPSGSATTFDLAGYVHAVFGHQHGDVINYEAGDGNLNLSELADSNLTQATLAFGAGITALEIFVSADVSGNMYLMVGTSGNTITIDNQLNPYEPGGVSAITFADGTTLTAQQLISMADTGSITNQTLYARSYGAATFNLAGYAHAVVGYEQGDVINYAIGDGNLSINEHANYGSVQATLAFGAGITASEITVSADNSMNMYLEIGTSGDTISLGKQLNADGANGVSKIVFADGTTLTPQQLIVMADTGSSTNQTLYASNGSGTTFDLAGYAHAVVGHEQGDVINYTTGDGSLNINESSYILQSTLVLGGGITASDIVVSADNANNMYLAVGTSGGTITLDNQLSANGANGISEVMFADSTSLTAQQLVSLADTGSANNQTLYAPTSGAATFNLAGYAHAVVGYEQGDVINYATEDGNLNVNESAYGSVVQTTLAFSAGIVASEIAVSADGSDNMYLAIGTSGSTITLNNQLSTNGTNGISEVVFADGTNLTAQQLVNLADTGSASNQTLYAPTKSAATFNLAGYAHAVVGYEQGDVINYVASDGSLNVNESQNSGTTTAFSAGMTASASAVSVDSIIFHGPPPGGTVQATLAFGVGITASEITVAADSSNNMYLEIGTTGGTITLDNQLNTSLLDGISEITFADGTTWTAQQLSGFAGGNSVTSTTLYGSQSSATTFTPTGSAHAVVGYEQGDVISYAAGDGNLNIYESGTSLQTTLAFGAGITASEIAVSADSSNNMYLEIGTSGSTIALDNQMNVNGANGVSEITFVDGTTLTAQQLNSLADTGSVANQTLYAPTSGAATFNPAGYARAVVGYEQGDVISYAAGDGNLNIYESGTSLQTTLAFGAGITASEIAVSADSSNNMYLEIGTSGSTIALDNQMNVNGANGVSEITFVDGTTLTAQQLNSLADTGSVANQTLYAPTSGAATFNPAGYARAVVGYEQGDVISYAAGDGNLNIYESGTSLQTTLAFGAGITASEIAVSADSSNNMYLEIGTSGSTIALDNQMNVNGANGVSEITFVDGTTLTGQQLIQMADTGSLVNQTLYSSSSGGAATFDPAGYAHAVIGYQQGDVINYAAGDGNLNISETENYGTVQTTLAFGVGITASEIAISTDASNDMYLIVGTTGGVITLDNQFSSYEANGVSEVTFADGTTWSAQQLINFADTGSPINQTLYAPVNDGATTFNPNGYAHAVIGYQQGDVINYVTNDGNLDINESGVSLQTTLAFGAGITASEVTVSTGALDEVDLTIGATGGTITLESQLSKKNHDATGVSAITFADGTTWTSQQLIALADIGTPANQTLYGSTNSASTFTPAGYAHTVVGYEQSDVITYASGDGNLSINEAGTLLRSTLAFGAGITASEITVSADASQNMYLAVGTNEITFENQLNSTSANGISEVTFADGTTWTAQQLMSLADTGSLINQTLFAPTGGAANFELNGYGHAVIGHQQGDIINYVVGDGNLNINESGTSFNTTLTFGAGITASDIAISTDASDNMYLTIGTTGGTISLGNQLNNYPNANGISEVTFADGTTWTTQQLMALADTGSPTNQTLYALTGSATTFSLDGYAHAVVGYEYGDVINYAIGDGNLDINESTNGYSPYTTLAFGSGISASDIAISTDASNNVYLTVGTTGGTITLDNQLSDGYVGHGISEVTFADGTNWTYQQLLNLADTGSTTNAILYGLTNSAATFSPAGYAHAIVGYQQGDAINYAIGDGDLNIEESGRFLQTTLVFGASITASEIIVSADASNNVYLTVGTTGGTISLDNQLSNTGTSGISGVTFADGTSWNAQQLAAMADTGSAGNTILYGSTNGSSTFTPDGYAHAVVGYQQGDVINYATSDGSLDVNESGASVQTTLAFGTGIATSEVVVSTDASNNMYLTVGTTGGTITLDNQLANFGANGVSEVTFADGTTWTAQQLVQLLSSNTILYASQTSATTLTPAGNAHAVVGYEQGDLINYATGDGNLSINEAGVSLQTTLALGAGITASEIAVSADASNNMYLTVGTAGGTITLDNQLNNRSANGISTVTFADGTTWTAQQLITLADTGSPINQTLYAPTSSAAMFNPDGYAHAVVGYEQGDAINYAVGDGNLDINEYGTSLNTTLAFDSGIAASDVTASADASNNMYLTIGTAGGTITLDSQLSQNYNATGISEVKFADGETWSAQQLITLADTGSVTNQTLYAPTSGGATFDPAGYAQEVVGYEQGDTISYATGDGNLQINESGTALNTTLAFGAGIAASDITVSAGSSNNMYLAVGTTGGTISLDSQLTSSGASGVSELTFADGTSWTAQQLSTLEKAVVQPQSSINLTAISGNDTFNLADFSGTIQGNNASDTYLFAPGDNSVTIQNGTSAGISPSGQLDFQGSLSSEGLWFAQSGNNLNIDVLGSSATVSLAGWFANSGAQLSEIQGADGLKLDTGVNQLIAAMANYATDNPSFNPQTAMQMPNDTALQSAIAASWHA